MYCIFDFVILFSAVVFEMAEYTVNETDRSVQVCVLVDEQELLPLSFSTSDRTATGKHIIVGACVYSHFSCNH